MGMIEIIAPAAIYLQFALNMLCRLFIPTGRVYMDCFVSTILGHKNSPQLPTNVNTASVASAGVQRGMIILHHI